jgi:hypothetical protein
LGSQVRAEERMLAKAAVAHAVEAARRHADERQPADASFQAAVPAPPLLLGNGRSGGGGGG